MSTDPLRMVVLIKVLVDTHATGCKTQQLDYFCSLPVSFAEHTQFFTDSLTEI
jgi:hypothetical protein